MCLLHWNEFVQQGDVLVNSHLPFGTLGHKFCCYLGMGGSLDLRITPPLLDTSCTICFSTADLKLNLRFFQSCLLPSSFVLEADPGTRIQVQIIYFGDDPRKH